jgi:hypothetical protein
MSGLTDLLPFLNWPKIRTTFLLLRKKLVTNKHRKFQNRDPSMNLAENPPYSSPTTKFEKTPTSRLEKTTFTTSKMNRNIPSLTSSIENTTTASQFENTPTSRLHRTIPSLPSSLENTTYPTIKMNRTIPSLTSSLENTTYPAIKMDRTIPSIR